MISKIFFWDPERFGGMPRDIEQAMQTFSRLVAGVDDEPNPRFAAFAHSIQQFFTTEVDDPELQQFFAHFAEGVAGFNKALFVAKFPFAEDDDWMDMVVNKANEQGLIVCVHTDEMVFLPDGNILA